MGVARWAALWAVLILFSCMPAFAQQYRADDGGGASQGQYDRSGEEQATCVGAVEVARVGPETEGTVTPFRTTGRTFVVSYDVAFADGGNFGNVSVNVEDRFGLVAFENVGEDDDGSGSYVVTEGPGSYDLVVDVEQSENATYTVVVQDCRGGDEDDGNDNDPDDADGNEDEGDVDDPDDVVEGTGDKGPLPNTGGMSLSLGAGALLLAAGLLARRILAP